MNFNISDSLLGRQRGRQWSPLVTQQFRLRHVYQIFGLNFPHLLRKASYYYTLHLTTMSAPFYTSEKVGHTSPKWPELDQRNLHNLATTAIVIRVWQHVPDATDTIITTWGINLSGLVYLGNKATDLQSTYFAPNTVIFNMHGGFFTSHKVVISAGNKKPPFVDNLNLMMEQTNSNSKIYRKTSIETHKSEVRASYDIDKLRKLHSLQVAIKNKLLDVQVIKEKIEVHCRFDNLEKESTQTQLHSSPSNVRYAPQLLTMKSVNKMLEEKPTQMQRQEMMKIKNQIEMEQFRSKLLSHEKDKKTILIRRFKMKLKELVEKNEEINSNLMDDYHNLNKEGDKLKELKRTICEHQELLVNILTNLNHRRRQLLHQLLFIYPIQRVTEKKYTIHGICLPNSDLLSECSDTGLSIALGYITHILVMCSKFLQVPLRYPMTHHGSRSFITDHISSTLPDRERDFPLFTKGKDKIQFTYAVYLLNKNIAQLRWLFFMHTSELQATLPNLLTFLEGKDARDILPMLTYSLDKKGEYNGEEAQPRVLNTTSSSLERFGAKKYHKLLKSCECGGGPGLSEILAIPEAFMNKQISSDSFKNYIGLKKSADENGSSIVIKEGRFEEACTKSCDNEEAIEEGRDMLDPSLNLYDLDSSNNKSDTIEIKGRHDDKSEHSDCQSAPGSHPHLEQYKSDNNPLTARTDALLTTKTFNLVKTKSSL